MLLLGAGLAAAATQAPEPRAVDGAGNNLANPSWGAANALYTRLEYGPSNPLGNAYSDGVGSPARATAANPREISNTLSRQTTVIVEPEGFNEMLAWWLFHVHVDIAAGGQGAVSAPIPVPAGDDPFDLAGTGAEAIAFRRSLSTVDFDIPTPA
ncbi:MAG: peroxidase family protein, partial [Actinomycetota bacterium]|nr:peroxidase family protein [Actinomycetota bacterium]